MSAQAHMNALNALRRRARAGSRNTARDEMPEQGGTGHDGPEGARGMDIDDRRKNDHDEDDR